MDFVPGIISFGLNKAGDRILYVPCTCGGKTCFGGWSHTWPMNLPDISGMYIAQALPITKEWAAKRDLYISFPDSAFLQALAQGYRTNDADAIRNVVEALPLDPTQIFVVDSELHFLPSLFDLRLLSEVVPWINYLMREYDHWDGLRPWHDGYLN